ncbi:restriction endonuclease subunit S [Acinetobacter sp. ANC 7454]|uniref:restriction endonuclease subunit S n=1 Tax=Acinetobacter thermotolerans TaxID=3151487 RepID=UPI00325B7E2E
MAVPKLRFKEFNDSWDLKKLDHIAEVNPKTKELPASFFYIDLESVSEGLLIQRKKIDINEAPSRAQRLLEKSDVLFQMVRPYQQNNFYFDLDGDYVASTGYAQIRTKLNSKYIYYVLHSKKFLDEVINRCTGTSYPAINSSELSSIEVAFPSIREQTKIASFLSNVDEKINQLTQKHELLSQYKQGMMQKLFSQQIRFKADDGSEFGEWEDKKLGEISKTFSGGTPQSSNKSFYEGTIPFIKSGEISKNTTEQCINDLALEKSSAKLVKKGDLLYALYGATSGQVAISQIDGAINQAVLCIRSELNTKYLLNFLLLKKEEILTTYLQGGQGNLSASILKEIYIPTPCLEEQTKIANFLSAIDQKIEVVAQQIEQAKQWKKGLLQQMFV